VALTPLALVGGGAGLALVGFGLSAASGVGIGAALAKGDLGAAARVGLAFLSLEWSKVVASLTDKWNKFKDTFLEGWITISEKVGGLLADAVDTADHVKNLAADITSGGKLKPKTARELFDEENARLKAEREKARAADLAAALAAVDAAKKEFKVEVAEAMKPKPGGVEVAPPPRAKELQAELRRVFDSVKGGFGGQLAAQRFGYGDKLAQRSLVANEKAAKLAEDLFRSDAQAIRDALRSLPQGTKYQLLLLLLNDAPVFYRGT
jgi:hypothetical protein